MAINYDKLSVKRSVYLLTILFLLLGLILLVAIAPHHIYTLALTEGVNTRFLKMKIEDEKILNAENMERAEISERNDLRDDESLWQDFHFSHFVTPLPVHHPRFSFIPVLKEENDGTHLGGQFIDSKGRELCSFLVYRKLELELTSDHQVLFELPIFKNYIDKKSLDDRWRDLFTMKVSRPVIEGKSFFQIIGSIWNISYKDLVYQLYILYNRQKMFLSHLESIKYFENKNLGIVTYHEQDPNYYLEEYFLLHHGHIYTFKLRTKKYDNIAEGMRRRTIEKLEFRPSTPDSAVAIYARYKNIPYHKRIEQEGLTYLFSAWSHDLNNKDFLRVMIFFLERGHNNIFHLRPLYEYAYRKFGSNFSGQKENILETENEKVKRKIDEEFQQQVNSESKNMNKKAIEGDFANEKDKLKFYLDKAKEEKSDEEDHKRLDIN